MDLTLREGISLNEAIMQAKQIDEQSKQAGFYQEALDFTARKGFANARFLMNADEGMDEFYSQSEMSSDSENMQHLNYVEDIQQGLKQSVQSLT